MGQFRVRFEPGLYVRLEGVGLIEELHGGGLLDRDRLGDAEQPLRALGEGCELGVQRVEPGQDVDALPRAGQLDLLEATGQHLSRCRRGEEEQERDRGRSPHPWDSVDQLPDPSSSAEVPSIAGTFDPIGRKYVLSCPRWWMESNMSSHAT